MILRFRHPTVSACAILAVALVSARGLSKELPKSEPAKQSVAELLQQRRAVLLSLVEVQTHLYQVGKADIEAVVQAHQELLLVQLELAASRDERINLLKKAVHLAMELENLAQARYKAGRATQADVLKSQAAKLKAETDLLRERQKPTKH